MGFGLTACEVSAVPGQTPESFLGEGQNSSEVIRQETKESS